MFRTEMSMSRPILRLLSVNAHPHEFTHTAGTLGDELTKPVVWGTW